MDEVYTQLPFEFPPSQIRFVRVAFDDLFHKRFLAMHDYRCVYCGGLATAIDHFVPVALGGTNHPSNLYPACQSCNSTASWKLFDSFAEKQRFILTHRVRLGTLSVPAADGARPLHDFATCIDCGDLYRYAADATIFLCPICKYMDDHRPLPSWRRNRMVQFLVHDFGEDPSER